MQFAGPEQPVPMGPAGRATELPRERQTVLKVRSSVAHARGELPASSKTNAQVNVQAHEWRISSSGDLLLYCGFACEVDSYSQCKSACDFERNRELRSSPMFCWRAAMQFENGG